MEIRLIKSGSFFAFYNAAQYQIVLYYEFENDASKTLNSTQFMIIGAELDATQYFRLVLEAKNLNVRFSRFAVCTP